MMIISLQDLGFFPFQMAYPFMACKYGVGPKYLQVPGMALTLWDGMASPPRRLLRIVEQINAANQQLFSEVPNNRGDEPR